jgi:integrase
MPRKTLSDKGVAALKPRAKPYAHPDPEMPGHYVRVQVSGAKSFVAVTIGADRKQHWITLGKVGTLTIDDARPRAREAIKRVRAGLPAFETPPDAPETFKQVAERWLAREVRAKSFRTERDIVRILNVHVFPRWGDRPFVSIRRSDITALMDHIEDSGGGARQADVALGIVRSLMYWQAARTDDYSPPLTRGMRRQSTKHQARARVLDDDEIRAVWRAAEGAGTFGAIVRLCLLTAARSRKVAAMRWDDITDEGEWIVRREPREKGTADLVLPAMALEIIRAQPRVGNNPHIFAATRGKGPFRDWGWSKERFDSKLPELKPWVVHDLRRTARSLMSRAGVERSISERILGHAIPGVEGVYDRHEYRDEKRDALARLAALLAGIINGPPGNVVRLTAEARRR